MIQKLCVRDRSESGVQESGEDPAAKSTEQQELQQALTTYRNYRQGTNTDYRSPSPTGTEASAYNPAAGQDRLTSDEEDAAVFDQNEFEGGPDERRNGHGGLEPEAAVTLTNRPRDGYLGQDEAVGANMNPDGQRVQASVAAKPPVDDYV